MPRWPAKTENVETEPGALLLARVVFLQSVECCGGNRVSVNVSSPEIKSMEGTLTYLAAQGLVQIECKGRPAVLVPMANVREMRAL